ncbi:hypothetical protein OG204_16780 [Streptomyces sp. NBC_01387]|uniref:hypothetical protein n=1 Tax=unclassified Streptomyces TaxID=2593676 RepID=UPI00224DFB86|nr:hypothetical protein [Streptomyces sp. NBC_01500]MCX4549983.1 hypothetical protein [Streptomyces sp. NBC_01500]WSV55432.1 hypothetical protein OG282_17990 [Streptomyces sp. NBC_01014]
MAITDDLRKTLTDPTPLYFAAGTADIAVQQARKVPALIEKFQTEAPARIDAVRNTDPRTVQDRVATQAKEAQASVSAKFTEVIGTFDTDLKKLGETAQDLALRSIGVAAEYAVRARETYEKVAERGEQSVRQWRGEAADDLVLFGTVTESKAPAGPKAGSRTEPKAESKAGPKAEARIAQPRTAPKPGPKPAPKTVKSEAKPVAKPAAAKKTSTTPRKATAKKTTPPAGK